MCACRSIFIVKVCGVCVQIYIYSEGVCACRSIFIVKVCVRADLYIYIYIYLSRVCIMRSIYIYVARVHHAYVARVHHAYVARVHHAYVARVHHAFYIYLCRACASCCVLSDSCGGSFAKRSTSFS